MADELYLTYAGKVLDGERAVEDYAIEKDSTLSLEFRARGGVIEPSLVVLAKKYNAEKKVPPRRKHVARKGLDRRRGWRRVVVGAGAQPQANAAHCHGTWARWLLAAAPCVQFAAPTWLHAHTTSLTRAGLPPLLRPPAAPRYQLPEEAVRSHQPAAAEEEAEVSELLILSAPSTLLCGGAERLRLRRARWGGHCSYVTAGWRPDSPQEICTTLHCWCPSRGCRALRERRWLRTWESHTNQKPS